MQEPLGLSIGATNLVAARKGSAPVTRRAVLTLFPDRAPEIGIASSVREPGAVLSGFVEHIGDSATMFAADGSSHEADPLLVEALAAMVSAAGADIASSNIAIAVPAHWEPEALRSLHNGLQTHGGFVGSASAPHLVSDALAALTAINSASGLPTHGVVGLLDFGGSGTNMTLADAASDFEPIGKTVRYWDFSGDQIDQSLLAQVVNSVGGAGNVDPAATAAVGPLAQLREDCRQAKEKLSTETVTELTVDLSGNRSAVRISRAELESLVQEGLSGVLSAFDDLLARHNMDWADIAAVVTVGGGASIPLVTQRVSTHTRTPVLTAREPALSMALGAAMIASREPAIHEAPAATALAAAVVGATTGFSNFATADLLFDANNPGTSPKLAWSEDEGTGNDLVPFIGDPYDTGGNGNSRPMRYVPEQRPPYEPPRRRSGLPRTLLGLTALAAMMGIGGVAYSLSSTVEHQAPPRPSSSTVAPPPAPSSAAPSPSAAPPPSSAAPSPSPEPPPSVVPSPSVETPPPPPPPPPPPQPVTTTYQAPPTTVQPTATAPPTTTMSAAPPPPTTTTTTVPMTTEYLTLPLVPVPIPIQVPQKQADNQPQNPYVGPQNPYPQNPYVAPQNPYAGPGYP